MNDVQPTVERLVHLGMEMIDYKTHKQSITDSNRALVANALGDRPYLPTEERQKYTAAANEAIEQIIRDGSCEADVPENIQRKVQNEIFNMDYWDTGYQAAKQKMSALATKLPVWAYCQQIQALSSTGLGIIVAVSGDLNCYSNPAKLWSWWACGVDDDGTRQSIGAKWRKGMLFGHICQPLQKQGDGYKRFYYARRARTSETHPDWSKGHQHNDSMIVMGKKLLKYVWKAWRDPSLDKWIQDEEMYGYWDAMDNR